MCYLPELYYYLQDQSDFPFRKAVLTTAVAVSQWSSCFYAKLITPKSRKFTPAEQSGPLPRNVQEKRTCVAELVSWLFENSTVDELFCLFIDDEPLPQPGRVAKFDHHDDTCCWVLNLSENEFGQLQRIWRTDRLPEDLFYPKQNSILIPYPGAGLKARLLRAVGAQKIYTPKQWESERIKRAG